MGDSIVNDTMRSGWVALLQEAYPKAHIEATVYVRGGGGCQHFREENRVATVILPRRPDLVLLGGISQRDIDSIRDVIRQIRAGLPGCRVSARDRHLRNGRSARRHHAGPGVTFPARAPTAGSSGASPRRSGARTWT